MLENSDRSRARRDLAGTVIQQGRHDATGEALAFNLTLADTIPLRAYEEADDNNKPMRKAARDASFRTIRARKIAQGETRGRAACTGSQEPRVQANRGAVGSAASGTTNGVPASRTINIGHSSFIFGGGFADALVFDRDLLGDSPAPANLMSNAEYLELAHAYLDEQTGGFV